MTRTSQIVAEIRRLFLERGRSMYGGESVTQQEHALQAAMLAEIDQASAATIAAALLHDIGHMLHDLDDDAPEHGVDDVHEQLGYEWLCSRFPPEVTAPVLLHVEAKRYLCTVDPSYRRILSEPSLLSLRLQGGDLTAAEVESFEQNPQHEEVVKVRRYDDQAKIQDLETPDLEHFLSYVDQCVTDRRPTEASQ